MDISLILSVVDINEYLSLVDRRLKIISSGIEWQPEYDQELAQINKRLEVLRRIVDQAHAYRSAKV